MNERREILDLYMSRQIKYKAFAYTLSLDWSIAEEACQEAVLYICDNWEKYELGTNFNAWARSITKYKCLELMNKEHREHKKALNIAATINDQVWEKAPEFNDEKIKALHACIDKLPTKTKNIFMLFYQEKMKCEALSNILKMKENAIYKILSRTRNSLKICIKNQIKETL